MKYNYLLIVLLFFCSCQKNNDLKTIRVDLSEVMQIGASEVIDSFEIVKLDTEQDFIIQEIKKLCIYDSFLYVLDIKQNTFLVFNEKGQVLNSYHELGNGPNEYLSLNDFYIKDSLIYLLSRQSRKIIKLDMDLNYKESYNTNIGHSNITFLKDGTCVLFNANNPPIADKLLNVSFFDIKNQEYEKLFHPFSQNRLSTSRADNRFAKYSDSLFVFFDNDYQIYFIDSDGSNIYYNIDFGSSYMLPTAAKGWSAEQILEYRKNKNWNLAYSPMNLYIDSDKLCFNYVYGFVKYFYIYNKSKMEGVSYYFLADDNIPIVNNEILWVDNNCLITKIDAYQIIQAFESEQTPDYIKHRLAMLINDYEIDILDNPYLIRLWLKQDYLNKSIQSKL